MPEDDVTSRTEEIGILRQVPNIHNFEAKKLLEEYGYVRRVTEANTQELTSIYGIGEATAEKLQRLNVDGDSLMQDQDTQSEARQRTTEASHTNPAQEDNSDTGNKSNDKDIIDDIMEDFEL